MGEHRPLDMPTLEPYRFREYLEIEAELPTGAPKSVVRTENSRTLKFTSQGFEKE